MYTYIVDIQYKSSEATSRLAALEGDTFIVNELAPTTYRLDGEGLRRVEISFPNHLMPGGRGYHDIIEIVPKELIPQVCLCVYVSVLHLHINSQHTSTFS